MTVGRRAERFSCDGDRKHSSTRAKPTRKDTIFAGIVIVQTLFELLQGDEITVATFGVKAGAVIDLKIKKPFDVK